MEMFSYFRRNYYRVLLKFCFGFRLRTQKNRERNTAMVFFCSLLLENKLLLSKRQNDYHQDEQNRDEEEKRETTEILPVIYGKWMSRHREKLRVRTTIERPWKKKTGRTNSCGWIPAVLSSMFVTDKRTIFTFSSTKRPTHISHSNDSDDDNNIVKLGKRKKEREREKGKNAHLLMPPSFCITRYKLQFISQKQASERVIFIKIF